MKRLVTALGAALLLFTLAPGPSEGYGNSSTSDWEGGINENWEQNYESDFPGSIPEPAKRLPVGTVVVAVFMLGAFAGCLILEARRQRKRSNNG